MASSSSFVPRVLKEGMDEWSLVIKVKYGDILRRFSFNVKQQAMIIEYDMNKLKEKISNLFNFSNDVTIVLTYTDEDGDVVVLDNDDELRDAVLTQMLNPLRVSVHLKPKSVDDSPSNPTAGAPDNISDTISDTVNYFSHILQPDFATELNSAVKKSLKSVPDPIRGVLSNISREVMRTASTAPVLSELLSVLSKREHINVSQSHQETINKPAGTSCGYPSCAADIDARDASHASNSQPNQPLSVIPQTDFINQCTENNQKMDETCYSSRQMESINHPFLDFDHKMSKKRENCELCTDGKLANPYAMHSFPPKGCSYFQDGGFGSKHGAPTSCSCHPTMLPPYRRPSSSFHDRTSRTFHKGVICDGCGMHPIIGPRYKSTVKENFDLCGMCFQHMGKEAEYTRIDWSAFRFPSPKKDHHRYKYRNQFLLPLDPHVGIKVPKPKLGSCFIRDVTVWDGTVMRPSSRFTKIWRMHNNGTIAWPRGTQLVRVRGHDLGGRDFADLEIPEMGFPVDDELDIAVDFVAPLIPGQYISYWQMASPFGQKFGDKVWVIIQVNERPSPCSSCASPAFLNLNLPPENDTQGDPFIMHANSEPLDHTPVKPDENKVSVDLDMLNSSQKDGACDDLTSSPLKDSSVALIDIPISSLTISNPIIDSRESSPPLILNQADVDMLNSILQEGTSVPKAPPVSEFSSSTDSNASGGIAAHLPPVSYPLIDISSSLLDAPTEENAEEQTLLWELEEMGFKLVDLNKEVLRRNQYDLEQSVEDLCAYSEWDPLLKELQEMGFSDRELNRKLLTKNDGSLKRVVMELITGENGE